MRKREPKRVTEARQIITHELAPTLNPQVSGFFSVRYIAGDAHFAELELLIVDTKNNDAVLHSFGRVTVARGRNATLQGLESTINFLPKDI